MSDFGVSVYVAKILTAVYRLIIFMQIRKFSRRLHIKGDIRTISENNNCKTIVKVKKSVDNGKKIE